MSSKSGATDQIVVLVIILLLGPPIVLWQAYVASKMWAWFLVPAGAPQLGVAVFAGIIMLYRLVFKAPGATMVCGWEALGKTISTGLMSPAAGLLVGWLVFLYIG